MSWVSKDSLDAERMKNKRLTNALENKKNDLQIALCFKRKASEDLKAKDALLTLLRPPKFAKNEYLEQKPAKYIFKCMDGDIQIPEYGILRTEFYYKA